MSLFEGKVVVVIGAGSGIGRACALAFAARGAKVIVADIAVADGEETVGLIKTAGGNSTFVPCNVARSADVSSLMAESVRTYGRLDYACNNARCGGPPKITDEILKRTGAR